MISYWQSKSEIKERVYIPKYYDPQIQIELDKKSKTHTLVTIKDLILDDVLSVSTGDEIGKMAYGTGSIPFVRTSDISNWEIKSTPKQGVSSEIYSNYSAKQDVRVGDILLVRDGTYLIGSNCIVTELDEKILYQSHILKFRILDQKLIDPHVFFLLLNSNLVQKQIRSMQFTADTIDTIGNRFKDIVLPIPNKDLNVEVLEAKKALNEREIGKAFIKKAPALIEEALNSTDFSAIEQFIGSEVEDIKEDIVQETVTDELTEFSSYWIKDRNITNKTYIPKYYDPLIDIELDRLSKENKIMTIGSLIDEKKIEIKTGDEIGKISYGTGAIPFIRTSDFSNWEIKHNPKQGISEDIYQKYASKQDMRVNDILLVRDGTYLVGTSCIVTEEDQKSLYCAGLIKLRCLDAEFIDSFFLLGILNSHIVKKQLRSKQFTRDVIDTLGTRLTEIKIPIPLKNEIKQGISRTVSSIVDSRIHCRRKLSSLSNNL